MRRTEVRPNICLEYSLVISNASLTANGVSSNTDAQHKYLGCPDDNDCFTLTIFSVNKLTPMLVLHGIKKQNLVYGRSTCPDKSPRDISRQRRISIIVTSTQTPDIFADTERQCKHGVHFSTTVYGSFHVKKIDETCLDVNIINDIVIYHVTYNSIINV